MVMLNRRYSQGSIHPGYDIAPDELEFALAMHAYQKKHRRRYPAFREVLYVFKSLGYVKGEPPDEPDARIPQPYFGLEAPSRPTPAEIQSCS